jgi:hypothetical protein
MALKDLWFPKNVGTIDRIIRTMIGLAAFGAGIYFRSWWGALGVIPIATAVMSRCGVYRVFGMSTCKMENKQPVSNIAPKM